MFLEITGENELRITNRFFRRSIKMNKVLITGLGIGNSMEVCGACNMDYSWLITAILRWREYDEVYRAKEVISDLIRRKNSICSEEDIKEVISAFEAKKKAINTNINKRFPSIWRWANLVTIVASPVTVYSALSGEAAVAAASASLIGLSTSVEKAIEVYKSRNNWVGFFDKKTNRSIE